MEFKRRIYQDLLAWKRRSNRVPLIIQGLRQTGKTTVAIAFANAEYKNAFYVDFRKQLTAHSLFDGDFDIDKIVFGISALPREKRLKNGSALAPGETLIIFDEIQDCPNARSCLKYFREDKRFDVLCTGSLLGVKGYRRTKKPRRGIPVGSEERLNMYPMDFEEFLMAVGTKEDVIASMHANFDQHKAMMPLLHGMLGDLFRQYMVVGGMPEAVAAFVETHNYVDARKVLRRILSDYESDFGTHLNDELEVVVDDVERALIGEVFRSIPNQLAKENKKFQYSVVKKNGDARTYGFALQYLEDYGLIRRANNLSCLNNPLSSFVRDDQFKIYLCDTGLFIAMLDQDVAPLILTGDMGTGKGAIYENIFADAYAKKGRDLYYYRKESGLEIDFIDSFHGEVTLIEIKAKSGATKSASTLLNDERAGVHRLIRITGSNIGYIAPILTIPHYLTHCLGEGFRFDKDSE